MNEPVTGRWIAAGAADAGRAPYRLDRCGPEPVIAPSRPGARGLGKLAGALAVALSVAACGSVADTVADLNPLGNRETPLPGDREAFFSTNNPVGNVESARAASIGPAQPNSDWPQPGGNARNDPGHLAFDGSGSRVWRASLGGTGGGVMSFARDTLRIAARPVVADNKVFVYTPDGAVTALSLGSGSRVWRTSLRPEKESDAAQGGGVAVDGGRVYAATGYGAVAALDAGSGKILWTAELDAPARSAPTAAAGKVFVVTQTNEVYALDQADGSTAFTYAGIPEAAGVLAAASPAVSGSTVVVPYSSGEVMAFNIADGEPKWANFVTRSMRTLAVSGLSDVSGSPVIDGKTVYATGVAGRTVAVSLATGDPVWENDIGSANTPVLSGDALFLVDIEDRMVAIDRSDGSVLWARELPKRGKRRDTAWSGPVLAGNQLWAISNDGMLVAIDPTSGAVKRETTVGSAGFVSPVVAGGRMIVVSDAGEISALR